MLLDNRSRSKSKSHIEVKRNLILMVSERAVRGHTGMTKTIFFDREPIATDIPEIPIATIYALYFSGPIALFRAALTLLRATGLTAEQTLLLAAIAEAGSPRTAGLSRSLGIDASTIAANLKPLMRQELVFAPVDITDPRARRLFLTVAGSKRLERGIKQFQEYEGGLAVECDGDTDLRGLYQTLSSLPEACL
jgi:DNA-binding MarR family transcriptional regulator